MNQLLKSISNLEFFLKIHFLFLHVALLEHPRCLELCPCLEDNWVSLEWWFGDWDPEKASWGWLASKQKLDLAGCSANLDLSFLGSLGERKLRERCLAGVLLPSLYPFL